MNRSDFAETAASVLTSSGHEGKIYELAGDTSYTLTEFTELVAQKTKKPFKYQNHTSEEYQKILVQVGIPEGFAGVLANSDEGASQGHLYSDSKDLKNLLGRDTESLDEVLTRLLK